MALKATPLLILLFATFVLSTTVSRRDGDYYDDYYDDIEDAREDALEAAALESRIERAHGIIGTITFALLFPLGGILLRLLPRRLAVPLHAAWQVLALCLAIATLGMGVWMAQGTEYINTYHAIIGIVAVASVCLQPITGLIQHRLFKKRGGATRTALSYVHVWWGIGAVTLGAINGGFGLQLNGAPTRYMIVYGVFAAVIWLVWMGISFVSQCLGGFARKKAVAREGEERELKQSAEMRETESQERAPRV